MAESNVIILKQSEIDKESNTYFMGKYQTIVDRKILSREQAINDLIWYRGCSWSNSPCLKLAVAEARSILTRGPVDPQADAALQWVSAFQAIRVEDGVHITYDNEENKFSFMIECLINRGGYLYLDFTKSLILPKPEKKETPQVNTNCNTTTRSDAQLRQSAPPTVVSSNGSLSNYVSISRMAHDTQWPTFHPRGTLTPPNSFIGGQFNHNPWITAYQSMIWTLGPLLYPCNRYVQTRGLFLYEGEFDSPAETEAVPRTPLESSPSLLQYAPTKRTLEGSPGDHEIAASNERVARWMESTDLQAVSEWDAHDRATNYQFSTEGDVQAKETAWIEARDRYNQRPGVRHRRLQLYLASLERYPTPWTSSNGVEYINHH
ncbi:hypothetical protein BKA61DRAFT_704190 [Leptodontidium sp. MPI-SDFR-AT-0119]|nr:hypothetical protein BKA61DRAFT_704190 [Leptodontidium sp. MPI-SDFR-AT-0119]